MCLLAIGLISTALLLLDRSFRGRRGETIQVIVTHGSFFQPLRCSTRAWKQALARAGIGTEFRWHDLRHTWASWHVQSGTRLQELMELGSWSSYEMVLRYAHLATNHLRDAAHRIDGTFTPPRPKLQLIHSR